MSPARILWVSGQAERYGADRSLLAVVRQLAQRGWEVRVVVPGPGGLTDDLNDAGVPTVLIDPAVLRRVLRRRDWMALLLRDVPSASWRIYREARSADVVHVNAPIIVGGIAGAVMAGRPVVCHIRESFADHRRSWHAYARVLRPFCSRFVAVSRAICDEASEAGLGPKTSLIHNGVEWDGLPSIPEDDGTGPVVAVGRINDWKGQPVLVEAVRLLRDRGQHVEVQIAGDSFPGQERYARQLRDLIARSDLDDRIRLLGFVEDVGPLLGRCRLYVQPSVRPEPFGMALVEAMAAGRACIASAAGGPLDIIDDGQTGILVTPGDSEGLADAIWALWEDRDRRHALGRAARAAVLRRFDVEREVDAIEQIYRELIDG